MEFSHLLDELIIESYLADGTAIFLYHGFTCLCMDQSGEMPKRNVFLFIIYK